MGDVRSFWAIKNMEKPISSSMFRGEIRIIDLGRFFKKPPRRKFLIFPHNPKNTFTNHAFFGTEQKKKPKIVRRMIFIIISRRF